MSFLAAFAGSVPANYDKYLGPVLFEPYALDLVARLNNPKHVLELACGTGRVTRHLVQKLPIKAKLIATDINPDMIAVARQTITDRRIDWQVQDAQELSFENDSFDHIICQFGAMFFPDKPEAMKEAYRVLQPGGKYIFNVWDEMQYNPRSKIIKDSMEEVMGDDAPDFLSKGPYSWFNKAEIGNVLSLAGFTNITVDVVQKTAYYPSADHLLNGFVHGSPLSVYLSTQPEQLRNTIINRMRERLINELGDSNIISPMQAQVWVGEKD